MNKTELLLRMLEHPHDYTADEWHEILQDEECRELYTLMSKTRGAVEAERADKQLTDEQIDAEWQRLANAEVKNEDYESGDRRSFLKIAASFVGLLIVSGIAFAAIRMLNRMPDNAPKVEQSVNTPAKDTIIKTTEDFPADSVAEASVEFDNLPLEQMLAEIASYYKAEVTFRNESARMLRFYFVWRRSEGLEQVVEDLNHFESLHVTLKDNLIIVE
jgi:ferric-dicitrate binding protein FerR (iron transport regulator)